MSCLFTYFSLLVTKFAAVSIETISRQNRRARPNSCAKRREPVCVHASYARRRGVVVSGVRRTNEVNPRRARLVPGWVTVVIGWVYHLGM